MVNSRTLPEGTPPDFEFDYVDIGAVGQGRLTSPLLRTTFANAPSRARRIVRDGDTLVSTVRTYLKATVRLNAGTVPTVASTGFAVLTPRDAREGAFLGFAVQGQAFLDELTANSVGIAYPAISESRLSAIRVMVPPLEEQAAIVRYLTYATKRIERAIAAKQRLLALIDEQWGRIVHDAVIGGLDSEVEMRNSGVSWLGQIPAHWEVHRAKYLFDEVDDRSGTGIEQLLSLRARSGLVRHEDVSTVPINKSALVNYKKVQSGQLVMNRMRAAVGLFAVASKAGIVSPDYATMNVAAGLEAHYYLRLFKTRAATSEFRRRSTGLGTGESGFMRLYFEAFGGIRMPVPPYEEQVRIATHLANREAVFDQTTNRVQREIQLLREFRTRLTSDVLTGKVDVRMAAVDLPQDSARVLPSVEDTSLNHGLGQFKLGDGDHDDADQPE